jgi:hypothetical protein
MWLDVMDNFGLTEHTHTDLRLQIWRRPVKLQRSVHQRVKSYARVLWFPCPTMSIIVEVKFPPDSNRRFAAF